MMSPMLSFAGIERTLLTRFPELNESIHRVFGTYYDLGSETPPAYPVFESVLKPFLVNLLANSTQSQPLARIFTFLEEMATSRDQDVVTLLWIAILVPLVYGRSSIMKAWPLMGDHTRILATEVALEKGWQANLPENK
jgi:hypothetical protein